MIDHGMMRGYLLQACYALLDAFKHYHGYGTRIAYSTIRVLLAALTQHGAADGALLHLCSRFQPGFARALHCLCGLYRQQLHTSVHPVIACIPETESMRSLQLQQRRAF